jgi:hypothetical protein
VLHVSLEVLLYLLVVLFSCFETLLLSLVLVGPDRGEWDVRRVGMVVEGVEMFYVGREDTFEKLAAGVDVPESRTRE